MNHNLKKMKELDEHNVPTRTNSLSPTDNVVLCEHPRTIVNPRVISLYLKGVPLVALDIYNNIYNLDDYFSSYQECSFRSMRKAFRHFLESGEAIDCFLNPATSEFFEPYIQVPCGKCELCVNKKKNHIAIMCQMECQQHKELPIFVLLTYDPKFLPPQGVVYEDFQGFMKRLRNVYRDMGVKNVAKYKREHGLGNIRFCCCGEYGNDDRYSFRAHWHALLWDFPTELFDNDMVKCREYIADVWKQGFVFYKECDNGDAGFYIGKYIAKQDDLFYGNPPVVRHSQNLGVKFVEETVKSIVAKKPSFHDFKYCDRFDGHLKMLPMTSYYLHKLFPTYSKVPSYIKDAVRKLNVLTDLDPVFNIMEVDKSIRKEVGYSRAFYEKINKLPLEELNTMYADCCKILQHETEGKYLDYENNDGLIRQYLDSLFSDMSVDVASRAYQLKVARQVYNNQLKHKGTK